MIRTYILQVILFFCVSGCAPHPGNRREWLQTLPHQYAQFDVKLAWEIATVGESIVIDGVVMNVRYFMMEKFEVWGSALDASGRELSRSAYLIHRLGENETAPFTLKLPRAASGSKVRLLYRYVAQDGGGESSDATTWGQSFETTVP